MLLFLHLGALAAEGECFSGLLADEVLVQLFGVQAILDLPVVHLVKIGHDVVVHQLEELGLVFHLWAGFGQAEIESDGHIAVDLLLLLLAEACQHEVFDDEAVELL